MQCGAKCFVIQYEENEEMKSIDVKARSQVLARKTFRQQKGDKKIIRCTLTKK